ncbi:MAG TPA: hypothetical protein VHP36_10610, partial [Chitinispirillaceae bacterium]|nr:hypothetical protein [Chitinispirillaceae bacterium]
IFKYYQKYQIDSDEDEAEIRNVYMYTGGIIAASGIGLLVCGVFLLEYTGPVIRRDHTSINLKADVLNRELGAEISLSF